MKAKSKLPGGKRKRDDEEDADGDDAKGGKERLARNETEARMYEAVRKAGKAYKSGGAMGEFSGGQGKKGKTGEGGGGDEFQVMGTGELERMVRRK